MTRNYFKDMKGLIKCCCKYYSHKIFFNIKMHERESVITQVNKLCTNLMDDLAIANTFINDNEAIANFV